MNYMLLIYDAPATAPPDRRPSRAEMMGAYFAFTQEIVNSGELVAGEPLQGIETASTVTVRGGRHTVTDGPFAETKEVLGGYLHRQRRRRSSGRRSWRPRSPAPRPARSRCDR